ncbi:MAG: methyl-accepting chemotaxis protein [Thermodesulfobacteriota bacterium]
MDRPRYKRRIYIIDRRNQFRFIARFVAASLIGNLGAIIAFVLLARPKLDTVIYSMRMPDVPVSSIIMREIVVTSGGVTLLTAAIFAVTAYRLLSRLNGPLYNIQGKLGRAADGDLTARVVLRKNDSFQELATGVNTLLDRLHGDIRTLKELSSEARRQMKSDPAAAADSPGGDGDAGRTLAKMREVVAGYRQCPD